MKFIPMIFDPMLFFPKSKTNSFYDDPEPGEEVETTGYIQTPKFSEIKGEKQAVDLD